MNEYDKAKALSESLDAVLRGESADVTIADEEIRALTELGRSLAAIGSEPSIVHRAAVERLLQRHRADIRESVGAGKKQEPNTGAARETARPVRGTLPRLFVPLAAGGLAVVLAFVLLVVVAGGFALWMLRDSGTQPAIAHLVESTATLVEGTSTGAAPVPTATPSGESAQEPNTPRPTLAATATPVQNPLEATGVPTSVPVATPSGAAPVQPVTLRGVRGLVEVQSDGSQWAPVVDGQAVQAGQRIRASGLSSAQIAFSDGSMASLGPSADISLDRIVLDVPDARVIELTQRNGEIEHDVASADGQRPRYIVHTPSGTGEAEGTLFTVLVTPALVAHFSVDEGAVAVTYLEATVLVVAGQTTTIPVGQRPIEPLFRVTGEGQVTETGVTWQIAGQRFATHAETVVVGNPLVGDWVSVDGHLLHDGTRVADRIVLLRRSQANRFTLTGEVGAMDAAIWTVAGQQVAVAAETEIDEGLEVTDLVRVEGVIRDDGTLLAEAIRLVPQEPALSFSFVGVVQDMDGGQWTISGITVTVDADTKVYADPQAGDVVLVRGEALEDGDWLARSIQRLAQQERRFEFSGIVQGLDPWTVSGVSFETRLWTDIEEGVEIGDQVRVEGRILADGTWVADEIVLLDERKSLAFEFVGVVEQTDPLWVVSGITLAVDAATEIVGDIATGSLVKVEGHITAEGQRLASEIKLLSSVRLGAGCAKIVSVVLEAGPDAIYLQHGVRIDLDDGIIVEGELATGAVIELWVCVDNNGQVVVVSIVVIFWLDPGDIAVPTPIPAPTTAPPRVEEGAVTICHKPGTPAQKTKTIPRSALSGHLGHGDTMGPCK